MNREKNTNDTDSFAARWLPLGLLLGVALLLIAEMPIVPASSRTLLILIATTLLLVLWASCRDYAENLGEIVRRVPNLFVLLLTVWSVVAFFLSPYRGYATFELLRVLSGVAVYCLAGFALRGRSAVLQVAAGAIGIACAIALYDFFHFGQTSGGAKVVANDFSLLGTHENVATLLVLALPLALAYAILPNKDNRIRIAAQVATLIIGAALLLARTRTAWIGAIASVLMLAFLYIRLQMAQSDTNSSPLRRNRKGANRWAQAVGSPLVLMLIAFGVLIALGGLAPLLNARSNLNMALEDGSLDDRLYRWSAAARMASQRPLTGWGLGTWTVAQGHWTHHGDETVEVLSNGTGHQNIAHNYYVQWAAETGSIGVFLLSAVWIGFLIAGMRSIGTMEDDNDRALLVGSLCVTTAALVDAVGSPGYNVPGEHSMLWLVLGLGMAALRNGTRRRATQPLPATPVSVWVGTSVVSVLIAGGIVGWGFWQYAQGVKIPKGTLRVEVIPAKIVAPGTLVIWKAVFTDAQGHLLPTMPGTDWRILADASIQSGSENGLLRVTTPQRLGQSAIQVRVPATDKPVTVVATYVDEYGHTYEKFSAVRVQNIGK